METETKDDLRFRIQFVMKIVDSLHYRLKEENKLNDKTIWTFNFLVKQSGMGKGSMLEDSKGEIKTDYNPYNPPEWAKRVRVNGGN